MSLKKSRVSQISIDINFDSEDVGYKVLTSKRVFNFVLNNLHKGYNLIKIQPNKYFKFFGKTTMKLEAIKHIVWKYSNSWDNIECKIINDKIRVNPCAIGSKRDKLFYKLEGNKKIAGFALYIMALNMNIISLKEHQEFIKICKKNFKKHDVYIDNKDVQWFHILSKSK